MRLPFGLIILLLTIAYGSGLRAQLSNENLLAYYPFDGDVRDFGPNGFNGIQNGGTFGEDENGNFNGALRLDGFDDFIDISAFADLFRDNLTDMSIYFKVKFEEVDDDQTIISLGTVGDGFASNVFEVEYENDRFQVESETGVNGINNEFEIDQRPFLFDGNWHEMLIQVKGDSLFYCRDNQLIFRGTYLPSETTARQLYVGCFGGLSIRPCCFFGGFIDELQFYSTRPTLLTEDCCQTGTEPLDSLFLNLADTLTICQGDSTSLLFGSPTPGATYNIMGPDLISQDFFLRVAPEVTTTYSISAESPTCRMFDAEVTVVVIPESSLSISGPTNLCPGDELTLEATIDPPFVGGTFTWTLPDGRAAAGASLRIETAMEGTYIATYVDAQNCDTINNQVTVTVNNQPLMPTIVATLPNGTIIPEDTVLAAGTVVILSVVSLSDTVDYTYAWDGNFTPDNGNGITLEVTVSTDGDRAEEALDYQVTVSAPSTELCPGTDNIIIERSPGGYQIPELITPNGDGTNDVFRLYYRGVVEDYQLIVFNRWGQKVFSASDPEQVWDGCINGIAQNMDTYLYILSFTFNGINVKEEGQFVLLR